jgi:hypothetical protein
MSKNEREEMARNIKSELAPFLDRIKTKHESYELFRQSLPDFKKRFIRATYILELIGEKGAKEPRASFTNTVYNLFAYLGIVESLGNTVVDMVVMLVVANGRDFHIERLHGTPRVKHALSIMDLEKEIVPLTTKLRFLAENGLPKLARIIDSQFRNDIAHFKFDVKGDKIFIRGKPVDAFSVNSLFWLLNALVTVLELLQPFLGNSAHRDRGAEP